MPILRPFYCVKNLNTLDAKLSDVSDCVEECEDTFRDLEIERV